MNNLEMLFNDEQTAVDCKLLYQNLGLNKSNWSKWIKNNVINNDFFEEGRDYTRFVLGTNGGGKETINFWITIEFAKHICMTSKSQKAHEIRNYFIECEKVAKKIIEKPQQKELGTLEILQLATAEIERLQNRNNQLSENLLAYEKYGSAILVREFVKIIYDNEKLIIGEREMWKILKSKYLMKNMLPFAKYKKYFEVETRVINYKVRNTTKISPKGVLYFTNKLLKMKGDA